MGKFNVARATQGGRRANGGARRFDSSNVPAHQDTADCWVDQSRVRTALYSDDGTVLVSVAKRCWNRGGFTDEHSYWAFSADTRLVGVRTIRWANVVRRSRRGERGVSAFGPHTGARLLTSAPRMDAPVVASQSVDQFGTHGMKHHGVVARCFFAHAPVSVGYGV